MNPRSTYHRRHARRLALLISSLALAPLGNLDAQTNASTTSATAGASVTGRVQNVVTGRYLNNARVTVKGTDYTVYTDSSGTYRLVGLNPGAVTLEVFYTDLDVQEITLEVTPGSNVQRDVALTSKARYGEGDVVNLESFVVGADQEIDGQALAINEQRFAPNIKNVLATDSFGDVLGSNVGEFLKYIPGLTAEYSEVEIVGISVRGLGSNKTTFTADGAMLVTANATSSRSFNMNALALNNVARVELTKVPTPSNPADSLAGSVNMVSKSAFERSKAELTYGINFVGNSENLTLKKTPHSNGDTNTRKILSGFDFEYSLPLNKNFGVVVTGFQSNKYNEQHLATMTHNAGGTGTGASISRPYLQQFTLQDGPRSQMRTTFAFKADWRVTPNSVLSLTAQRNTYRIYIGTLGWTMSAGTVATPTGGTTPFSYGENYTIGASGRGAVTLSGSAQTFEGDTNGASLNYRFDNGEWKVESNVNRSESTRKRPNRGHFGSLTSVNSFPVRVSLLDTSRNLPGKIEVFDNANNAVDIYDPRNYATTSAVENPYDNSAAYTSASVNVRRRFNVFPFPTALQIGGQQSVLEVDTKLQSKTWTYNGPDGNPATPDSPVPLLMQVYKNQDSFYGYRNVPWTSVNRAYSAFVSTPGLFTQTPAQVTAAETYRISNSEMIEETVSAAYIQGEAKLFKNRLNILTGVRFEKTVDDGRGPLYDPDAVWVRNANGTFARDPSGNRIRKTEAGAAGSLQEVALTRKERAYTNRRSYDGLYPSLHLTFEAKENLLVRGAYAKTYGRPDFPDVIPNATFSENDLGEEEQNDPSVVRGTITIRNTALRPWTADNYDLSVEYYTQSGGILSGGVFLKEIKDFFGNVVVLATAEQLQELGLDPRYQGWRVSTKFNSGDARVTGAEFNWRQSLRQFGGWARYFTVFANGTKLKLEGNRQADFTTFIPESANWGISFNRNRVSFTARWNYRGLDKRTAVPEYGTDAYQYFKARTTLDLNASYRFSKHLSLVASAANVFNIPQELLRYGSQTPEYAKQLRTSEFGVALALGIRGSF